MAGGISGRPRRRGFGGGAGSLVPDSVAELIDLLRDYARQETLGPLRDLGGYLKFGLPGAFLVLVGLIFLAMAVLRGLQRLEFARYGIGSVVPYLAAALFLALAIGLCAARIAKTRKEQLPNDGKLRVPDMGQSKGAA